MNAHELAIHRLKKVSVPALRTEKARHEKAKPNPTLNSSVLPGADPGEDVCAFTHNKECLLSKVVFACNAPSKNLANSGRECRLTSTFSISMPCAPLNLQISPIIAISRAPPALPLKAMFRQGTVMEM